MIAQNQKILVLSLQKKSLSIYAKNVITSFTEDEVDVYYSEDSETQYDSGNAYTLKSYHNGLQFILMTAFYMPFKILTLLPKISRRYKILFTPTDGLWNIFFVLAFLLMRKKIVVTVHDARRHLGIENFLLTTINNFIRRRADHLVFLTKDQQQVLYDDLNLKQPYSIVPLGLFELEGVVPKTQHTSRNILFAGRVAKYKGVDVLIRAAEMVEADFDKLTIAGTHLEKIADTSSEKIQIINEFISNEKLVELLNASDLLVLPYLEASQSGVLTLGINSELPMICTRVNGLLEQLSEEECIFVAPDDVDALAEAIRSAFQDSKRYLEMKHLLAAKKSAMSWDKISGELRKTLISMN